MNKGKTFARIFVLIMAVLSISLFSFGVYAYGENIDEPEETTAACEDYQTLSTSDSDIPNLGKIILVSFAIGVVVSGVTVFIIFRSYKTNGQTEPYTYKKKAPLTLTKSEDIHVDTKIVRKKIERDNR